MSFDIIAYYTLGIALLIVIGFILYLRPPGWKFLSAIEAIFVAFAFMGCITLGSLQVFLIGEAIYLSIATVCYVGLMKSMTTRQPAGTVADSSTKNLRFRLLVLAYLFVVARLLLRPFLPFFIG